MTIKIVLAGPRGKMGREAIKMIQHTKQFELIAVIDRQRAGTSVSAIENVPVYYDAKKCFTELKPDVFVDLTVPDAGFTHTKLALENEVKAVVGTSGFTETQLDTLRELANAKQTGCIIAPNFAIGAVLMMLFAQMAAKYFPNVEIIEKHHDQKIDAPSGTAVKTADMINKVRTEQKQGHPEEYESIKGARGADIAGMKIHSVRLPGLIAHQKVIFGGKSELLTIKHDSFHRESFMNGLKLAIEKVMTLQTFVYGLENILDLDA